MSNQTRDEWAKEHEETQVKAQRDAQKEHDKWAEDNVLDESRNLALRGEEAEAHLAAVRSTQIFGDTDTTAGASASGTDVPSHDNEAATVAVASKDAQAEDGDDDAADTTDEEARRQVDADAGTTGYAEDVDEAADDDDDDEEDDEEDVEDDTPEEDLTPAQKAARTRAANKAKEEENQS